MHFTRKSFCFWLLFTPLVPLTPRCNYKQLPSNVVVCRIVLYLFKVLALRILSFRFFTALTHFLYTLPPTSIDCVWHVHIKLVTSSRRASSAVCLMPNVKRNDDLDLMMASIVKVRKFRITFKQYLVLFSKSILIFLSFFTFLWNARVCMKAICL